MTSELIVFLVLSLVAISSALGMAFSRNAIYTKDFLLAPVPTADMLTPRKVEAGVFTRSVPEMKDPRD